MKKLILKVTSIFTLVALMSSIVMVGFVNEVSANFAHFNTHPSDQPTMTVRNKTEQSTTYSTELTLKSNQEAQFRVYIHNVTYPEENLVAKNTMVKVKLSQSSDKKTLIADASIWADGAPQANGQAKVQVDKPQNFEYIAGSAKLAGKDVNGNNFGPKQISDDIVTSGVNIGDVKGCWEFIHQIVINVKLSDVEVLNPGLSVDKKVVYNGTEYDSVNESTHKYTENENVQYRVYVKNTGSSQTNNVVFVDQLPSYINWTSGDGSYDSGANKVNLNIGTLNAGETRTINYTAKVETGIPNGTTSQTNVVTVTTDNAGSKSDQATVYIFKETPSENRDLSIDKKVVYSGTEYDSVSTSTHRYGKDEEVSYKITVKSTGNARVNNVKIVDELPSYINWKSGDGSYDSGSNKVTFSIGDIPAGESRTVNYKAKVESDIPAGETSQTNTVTATSDNVGERKDSSTVVIFRETPAPAPQVLPATTVTTVPKTGASEAMTLIMVSMTALGALIKKFTMK